MTFNRSRIARAVSGAVIGASLYAITGPALSQTPADGGHRHGRVAQMSEADRAQMQERMREHRQARMNERLDRLATRLDIKPSQQEAWAAYRRTIESMMQNRPQHPARDADAATLTRFRAEMMQRRAQHLFTLADATAQFQQVLEPEQRKVLDQVARRFGKHGHRGGGRFGHHRGPGAEQKRG